MKTDWQHMQLLRIHVLVQKVTLKRHQSRFRISAENVCSIKINAVRQSQSCKCLETSVLPDAVIVSPRIAIYGLVTYPLEGLRSKRDLKRISAEN